MVGLHAPPSCGTGSGWGGSGWKEGKAQGWAEGKGLSWLAIGGWGEGRRRREEGG